MQLATNLKVRWLIRQDMKRVLELENRTSAMPWEESDFLTILRERNVIGMVAVDSNYDLDDVYGFMIYSLEKDHIEINKLVYGSLESGAAMVDKLKSKLSQDRRTYLTFNVPESSLDLQMFLSVHSFKASRILRDHFDTEDAYHFEYHL